MNKKDNEEIALQIFVSGTWSEKKALPFAQQAILLGKLIASQNYDLACGPGTGIARYVIEGYRSVESRGIVKFYLPSRVEMEKVGEEVGFGADEIIETELDYPLRNIFQVRDSDALFILTGGDGTLEEAITALADYHLPVAAVKDSGTAAKALELLVGIFHAWNDLLMMDDEITTLLDHISNHLRSSKNEQSR